MERPLGLGHGFDCPWVTLKYGLPSGIPVASVNDRIVAAREISLLAGIIPVDWAARRGSYLESLDIESCWTPRLEGSKHAKNWGGGTSNDECATPSFNVSKQM